MRIKNPRKGKPRPKSLLPNPAPGRLEVVQSFLNTRDDDSQRDELPSPEALRSWLARHNLAPANSPPFDEPACQSALHVRDGLRALLRTHSGLPVDEGAVGRLNRAIHEARPHVALGAEGGVAFEAAAAGWAGALARLIEIVVEAIVEGRWKRLKACHNPDCQWAFYDASSNLKGKWCNVRRCGNRANTKSYRRRNREVPPTFTRFGAPREPET